MVKLYFNDINIYKRNRYKIEQFHKKLLNNEFNQILDNGNNHTFVQQKQQAVEYVSEFEEYSKLIKSLGSNVLNDNDESNKIKSAIRILENVATTPKFSNLLELFIIHWLPTKEDYSNSNYDNNKSDLTPWLLSEYLYIVDDICGNYNGIVLFDI